MIDHYISGDREAAQWQFECTWNGQRTTFDSATVSRSAELIAQLREYQSASPSINGTVRGDRR